MRARPARQAIVDVGGGELGRRRDDDEAELHRGECARYHSGATLPSISSSRFAALGAERAQGVVRPATKASDNSPKE